MSFPPLLQVVLNLANREWPRRHMRDEEAPSCAAPINMHRIRSLLARGKVILSEVSRALHHHTSLITHDPLSDYS